MDNSHVNIVTTTITIFLLLNSYAQIPVFLALLSNFDQKRQRNIILREMLIALGVLLLFIFFGNEVLTLIGISEPIIRIAGGLLLVIISLNMIFPKESSTKGMPQNEPFIVPLAIPCIAGPGTMTALMVLAKESGVGIATTALIAAWIPSLIILLASSYIRNYLGEKGIQAIERLGGMLIVLIGVQMFATGVVGLVKQSFPLVG